MVPVNATASRVRWIAISGMNPLREAQLRTLFIPTSMPGRRPRSDDAVVQDHPGCHRHDEKEDWHRSRDGAETAGPGQNPARPQPTPNITEPATSRPSILIFVAIKARRSACQLIA